MGTYDSYKKKLLAQRQDLFRLAARTEEDLLWLETDVEREHEERAQDENLIRLLDRLDGREKAEIEAIDRALGRIAAETYGVCERCGSSIPQERLDALPATMSCVVCARARESVTS